MNATTTNAMLILGLATTALLGTGCVSMNEGGEFAPPPDDSPSLALLGPAENPGPAENSASPTFYCLGAGDTLGEAVFANYIALVQASTSQNGLMAGPAKSE